ncbi:MAG TPA: hypothetical protein VKP02_08105, partial [Gemmatimonadaceae bacterium]|nr:hypothetical protein [Gemmatimonadaceae bacterium]
LDDDPLGIEFGNDATVLTPQARAAASKARAAARAGYVLAGESTAYDIDRGKLSCSDAPDILEPLCIWPMPLEHETTERIYFNLPSHWTQAGTLEAQLETTNAREEGTDHSAPPATRSSAGA